MISQSGKVQSSGIPGPTSATLVIVPAVQGLEPATVFAEDSHTAATQVRLLVCLICLWLVVDPHMCNHLAPL